MSLYSATPILTSAITPVIIILSYQKTFMLLTVTFTIGGNYEALIIEAACRNCYKQKKGNQDVTSRTV